MPKSCKLKTIELINDKYIDYSINVSTLCKRGEESERVFVNKFKLKILAGKGWELFFNNTLNQHDLIVQLVVSLEVRKRRRNF